MADKQAIRAKAINHLTRKLSKDLSWRDFRSALIALTGPARGGMANGVYNDTPNGFQRRVQRAVRAHVHAAAVAEVDAVLADDNLTLDEFERLFSRG